MSEFFSFLKVLVLCIAGLVALVIILLVVVNYLPKSPLRDIIGAVTMRIGATAAVAVVSIPVQPILGIDGIYDIVSSILLLCYWLLLIKDIRKAFSWDSSLRSPSTSNRTDIKIEKAEDLRKISGK